jgi:hypothetical protein
MDGSSDEKVEIAASPAQESDVDDYQVGNHTLNNG